MKSSSVRCHCKVPTPLSFTYVSQNLLHLFVFCSIIPSVFGFDMCLCQLFFQTVTNLVAFVLTVVYRVAQSPFAFAMAYLACAIDHVEWTLNMVVTEFNPAIGGIWHVTVGTAYASLSVNAHSCCLISGVLSLYYWRFTQCV